MKQLLILILAILGFQVNAQNVKSRQEASVGRLRFAINAGFSQRLAKISESVPQQNKDYLSELKSGYHYGVDGSYFIWDTWGLGLKLNQFKASNSGTFYDAETGGFNNTEDNITTTFIGPSAISRYISANMKHSFIFSIAFGYLGYVDNGRLNGSALKFTGATFGSALDAGYDFNITKRFAIGTQLSFLGGALKSLNGSDGVRTVKIALEDDQKESLVRLDISLGARFNF